MKNKAMKTNRTLFKVIFFSIITCGIYYCFFLHAVARDMNEICESDNDHTTGFLGYVLLNILTLGIYSFVWWYKLGNRLQRNGRRLRCTFPEDGSHILLWQIFGALICGIGPLIALNIVIRNLNELAYAYNHKPLKKEKNFWQRLFNL